MDSVSVAKRRRGGRSGVAPAFTLIELLIVVAIIAILALIAVPNFLEAQVRAKVARVRNDLRAIATALESYASDWSEYPLNDGFYNVLPLELTTPIAYLTTGNLVDPFCVTLKGYSIIRRGQPVGERVRYYTYTRPVTMDEVARHTLIGRNPPTEGIDGPNPHAFEKYGQWRLVSNGPDMSYADPDYVFGSEPVTDPMGVLMGSDVLYDPTNGTMSYGNLLRTQRNPEGKLGWP
jgi:prepilin-type N-terminal cleavage/methylation domain-containing protein